MTQYGHTHHGPERDTPRCRTWTGLAGLGTAASAAPYLSPLHVEHGHGRTGKGGTSAGGEG